jgi:hypothetical protein
VDGLADGHGARARFSSNILVRSFLGVSSHLLLFQENIPALLVLAPAAVVLMLPSASMFTPFPIEGIQGA